MARRFLCLIVLGTLALVLLRGTFSRRGRGPAPHVMGRSLAVPEPTWVEERVADPVELPPAPAEPEVDVAALPVEEPPAQAPEKKKKKGDKKDASEKLFGGGVVPRIDIRIDPRGIRSLERNPRAYVEATVDIDGKAYERVGVHLKGAAGSFQPVGAHPALTLKLNKNIPGQKLHGLSKIHLNNSVQDRSYLHELLAGELFLAAGVPAARAGHARVILNGRDLGLYVLKEAFDRPFLRRHFQDDSGNLYDGGFCQDINRDLENDTHRESRDQSDLRRLVAAAEEGDLEQRWRRLGEILDVDRFLSFLALEVLLWDWDGYPMKPNNYRIYHDPTTDRLVFFPHGMDQLWAQPEGPIYPPMGGLVARALLEIPTGKARYFERLQEIHAKIFRPEAIERRIVELRDLLLPLVREAGASHRGLESRMMAVRDRVHERARSVERQLLQKPARPLALDASGRASLATQRWYPEKDTGGVEVREIAAGKGQGQLLVDSLGNRCLGSWRCRVLLGRGAYTFSGRVRTEGVTPLSDNKGAGAGLRLGGTKTPRRNQAIGDSGWQQLEHEFEVRGAMEEVELLCELRATEGQAWFDRSSLAIVARSGVRR